MILTPAPSVRIQDLEKVKKLCLSIGFTNIQISSPDAHDRMIAFTSQLAHVVSSAYVKSDAALQHKGFSAGSYRDMTRVARLNEFMWTELFLDNAEYLTAEIDGLIERLGQYRDAIKSGSREELMGLLKEGRERKAALDGEDGKP
jgi:prephenate dehydrogenase